MNVGILGTGDVGRALGRGEAMCMVRVLSAMRAGTWAQAFKLLRSEQ